MIEGQRTGIVMAISTIIERVAAGKLTTSIILPTRYGKSNVITTAIARLIDEGLIACGVVLSPYAELRGQIIDKDKVADRLRRAGMDAGGFSMRTADRFSINMRPNEESCLSMTTQGAHFYGDTIRQWIEYEQHRTGKPVALFIDECDCVTHTEQATQWGYWPRQFIDAGHPVILLTATPERSDDERIIGFEYKENVVDADLVRYRTKDSPKGEEYIRVEKWLAERYRLQIKADYKLEFWEAWQETPLPICKISRLPFDVQLREIGDLDSDGVELLSEMSESQVRRNLSRIVRHPSVIDKCVDGVVRSLRQYRANNYNDVGAIVFSCNDVGTDETEQARHARDIERSFKRIAPELRCVVVTHKMKNAEDEMRKFKLGGYDVAIVKRMGAVGLDCPRIKVVGDLSQDRQYRSWVQRINRASTVYGALMWADLHHPDDCIARNFWIKLRGPLGEGDMTPEEREAAMHDLSTRFKTKLNEYDKEREEGPERENKAVAGVDDADFGDSEGREARAAEAARVQWFLESFPEMKGRVSEAQIAEKTRGLLVEPMTAGGEPRDLDRDIASKKAALNSDVRSIAGRRASRLRIAYEDACSSVWTDVKHAAGVPSRFNLPTIFDLRVLERLEQGVRIIERAEMQAA